MDPWETRKAAIRVGAVLRDYARAALRQPVLLAGSVLGTVLLQVASVGAPLVMRGFVNHIAGGSPQTTALAALLTILVGYAGMMMVGWLGRRVQMIAIMTLEARAMVDLYNRAFGYLIGHAHEFFISNFAGTLTRRVTRYAASFETVLDSIILGFLPILLFASGAIVMLARQNLVLGLGLLGWTLTSIAIQSLVSRWRRGQKVLRAAADSRVTGTLADAIGNHSAVMQYAAEAHERGLFAQVVEAWRLATMKVWWTDAWSFSLLGLLTIAFEIGMMATAAMLWTQGRLTVGDFVLIQVYILALNEQLWNIGGQMRRLYDAFADASEMVDILDAPHAIADAPGARPLEVTRGRVSFDEVSFHFGGGRPILTDLALNAEREKVALVGPSGAGKSTITKLLLRLYDPTAGAVRIDGQDIRAVTQESLRRSIAFVPQEPILFHRTLRDNIAYGRPGATEAEVIAAARKARCHEFIERLPAGYDTYVGERGVKLSGGERQRVAIARAILKDAPILVLDEATSSLDSESEHLIQDALKTLMQGKTVIVIAHRLSTIMTMDRIVVIEAGAIAAQGTHQQLLAKTGGLYHKLWSIQAGSFLDDEAGEPGRAPQTPGVA